MPAPFQDEIPTRDVDLRLIRINRLQSAQLIDREHVETLAAQIREVGLLHAPVGRPLPEDTRLVELASGNHRFLAYKLLNERFPTGGFGVMPVKVMPMSDLQFFATLWSGNSNRRVSPVEIATWLHAMQATGKLRQIDIARLAHMSQQSVSLYLAINNAPAWLRDTIHRGLVPHTQVSRLKDLTADRARELVDALAVTLPSNRHRVIARYTTRHSAADRSAAQNTRGVRTDNNCPACGKRPSGLTLSVDAIAYICAECGARLCVAITAPQADPNQRRDGKGIVRIHTPTLASNRSLTSSLTYVLYCVLIEHHCRPCAIAKSTRSRTSSHKGGICPKISTE
jgi:ParB-like chromosome segregation protein Spo0J